MDNYEWYVNLMNFLDECATNNHNLSTTEKTQLTNSIEKYTGEDVIQLIHDIADANDCGECNSWNELITALRKLHLNGERISKLV